MKNILLGMTCATLVASSNIALADGWPQNVLGNWTVLGNQSPGTLRITFQASSGDCRWILGTIYGDPIQGFYCPASGRIHFVRKDANNNDTVQVWTGNLSQAGETLRMGGIFSAVTGAGGSPGEYNFQASK